jgi:hypothetical protein
LIAFLVPAAEWLVMELPSPPIRKIVSDWLPTLPIQSHYLPTKRLRRALNKAVEARNEIVHTGHTPSVDVPGLLEATADLLRLFDVYRGHDWALEHVSDETRQELGLAPREPDPVKLIVGGQAVRRKGIPREA